MTTSNCFYTIVLKFIVINLMIISLGIHVTDARKNTPLLMEEDGVGHVRPAGKRNTFDCSIFFFFCCSMSHWDRSECSLIGWKAMTKCMCWQNNENVCILTAFRPMRTRMSEKNNVFPFFHSVIFISVAKKKTKTKTKRNCDMFLFRAATLNALLHLRVSLNLNEWQNKPFA